MHAQKVAAEMRRIPFAPRHPVRAARWAIPTVEVAVDREKAGLSGVTVEDVAHTR